MFSITSYFQWIEKRSPIFVDLVRIYLGVGLFVRGLLFLDQPTLLTESIARSGALPTDASLIMHAVAIVHIGGGLLLAIGLATRIAALIQIPILLVAVFGIHAQEGLMDPGQSLEFSALVLFLILIIFVRGSGPLSLDVFVLEREPAPIPDLPPDEILEPMESALAPLIRSVDELDMTKVRPRPVFRRSGWFALFLGVRATPISVEFLSRETGEVVARTRDPRVLSRY